MIPVILRHPWLLAVIAALPAAGATAATPTHYVNDRYGFAADIPPGFVAEPPPDNDDGRTFRTLDGTVELAALAGLNTPGDTMSSYMQYSYDACRSWHPDYLTVHSRWAVLSCITGEGRVLYQKSFMRGRGDDSVFTTIRMTYPSSQRSIWDAVAVAASRSLVPSIPQ